MPTQANPPKRTLRCSCCGERTTTAYVQFFNQDTGFGMCGRCAEWIVVERKSMSPTEFDRCYGKAYVHRPPHSLDPKL